MRETFLNEDFVIYKIKKENKVIDDAGASYTTYNTNYNTRFFIILLFKTKKKRRLVKDRAQRVD